MKAKKKSIFFQAVLFCLSLAPAAWAVDHVSLNKTNIDQVAVYSELEYTLPMMPVFPMPPAPPPFQY